AGADFDALSADQQETLLATGSRYVWAHPAVEEARATLYDQVAAYRDGDAYVTWRLRSAVTDMMHALNVVGRLE
ncbi:MAG: class II D-tagatose-bisphosphate aldolase non-catalytic subunit, partial [Bacteroidota bacterium]